MEIYYAAIKGARFDFGEKYTFKNNFLGIEILVFYNLHVYKITLLTRGYCVKFRETHLIFRK